MAISVSKPLSILADIIGIIIGLALMYLATKNIRFEKREDGLYYRTHFWVELTILLLFFIRFSFRFYYVYQVLGNGESSGDMATKLKNINDPYTAGTLLVLFTYYIGYYLIVLKKEKLFKTLES